MRSEAVNVNAILLEHVVEELTHAATALVKQELEASAAAYVYVVIERAIVEHDRSTTTPRIDEHALSNGAVHVTTSDEHRIFEHND